MINSTDVINEIAVKNPQIASFRFFSFSTATKLQDRLGQSTHDEDLLISKALDKKEKDKTRFWTAMLSMFVEEKHHNMKLLGEVFYHQANRDYEYVNSKDVEKFLNKSFELPLAINSKVLLLDGSARHIPLLDFKVKSKCGHDNLVIECVRALRLKGHILDSGKSYHFIGDDLLSESELIDILAKFVLLDPISDKAWAAHQIVERTASLRISERYGHAPLIIDRV